MQAPIVIATILAAALALPPAARAQLATSLPISAELGTSIAQDQFPVTVRLDQTALFMTEPALSYTDPERIAIAVTFQAYDHRPDAGVAISETGKARFSGQLGFDPASRKILIHQPQIDQLSFDRDNATTDGLMRQLQASWRDLVTDPMRIDLPRHPYLIPFRQNISNLSFDGQYILVSVVYE